MKRETVSRIFRDQPTLETERLILRRISPLDERDLFEYASDPEVSRYLLWSPHPNVEYTRRYLSYLETRYAVGDFFDWAIVWKESGKMIGTVGFTRFRYEDDCGEVGYVLARPYWGKGIAPEALDAILRFGFGTLLLSRIEAKFLAGNERSLSVMKKVGMHFEGYLRASMRVKGELRTVGIASILSEEYRGAFEEMHENTP